MNAIVWLTFIATTVFVFVATRIWMRRLPVSADASEEYFAGGRALAWPVVTGSLLLTNISTEQIVGLNGTVFGDGNLVAMAWEATAAVAMIATALWFLPMYFRRGFATTPAFLEERFDRQLRAVVSGLFLLGYVTVLLPVVLYTGSLALIGIFDLQLPLWSIVLTIGVLSSWYAVFGGLKAVAISDTLNGVGLLVGGIAVPCLALSQFGAGSMTRGVVRLVDEHPSSLQVLGDPEHSVPWTTLLTGMLVIQLFYWSTNQVIVQRALGARSLADGQRGVLAAAALKLIAPAMLCIPGIIALRMSELDITAQDQVYPTLVRHVLPTWSLGLFAAVLVGSISSSFNSAMNSASTLFCLEFFRPFIRPHASDEQLVRVGRRFGMVIAAVAVVAAPMLAHADSIFEYLQRANGLYSVPIVAVFITGLVSNRASPVGGKAGMITGLVSYTWFTFWGIEGLHWLHGYAISFLIAMATITGVSMLRPRPPSRTRPMATEATAVGGQVWSQAPLVSASLLVAAVLLYVGLSWLAVRA